MLLWLASIVVLLPVVFVVSVLALANTGIGHGFIERQAASLSGGMVTLHGLSGRIPDGLRVAHLDVHDTKGVWLTLDGVSLDWSPSALLGRVARIDRLSADRISVVRLPISAPPKQPAPPSQPLNLPVRVDLRALAVARADLAPAVAGTAASLRIAGSGSLKSLDDAAVKLAIDRLDGPGSYHLDGALTAAAIHAQLAAQEPSGGLVAGLAKLPALGALDVHATLAGPRSAEQVQASLGAGPLTAGVHGTIDLAGSAASLDLVAHAPAMQPRPDVSWHMVDLDAHVHGPFTAPEVSGHANLAGLHAGGAVVASVSMQASGSRGAVDAHTVLTGLVLPPPQPDLFAQAPLDLTVHARLDQPSLPITFALHNKLIAADGTVQARGDLGARIHTVIPDLAPFASIGHVDIQGSTEAVAILARHGEASDVSVDGTAHFTGGLPQLPAVLGATRFGATARLDGPNFTISRAIVDGRAAHLDATGTDTDGKLAIAWHVMLSDLAALAPQIAGRLEATGRADSAQDGLSANADLRGDVGTQAIPRGPMTARILATGLPANPQASVQANGRFDGAPVTLDAQLAKLADGGFHALLKRADWRSLSASADMVLAHGQSLPTGTLRARVANLADFAKLAGQPLAGSVRAGVTTSQPGGHPDANIDVQGERVAVGQNRLAQLSLTGHVRDPATDPTVALVLQASGIAASGITGQAHVRLDGPQTALLIRADTQLAVQGSPATASTTAQLDAKAHRLTLTSLAADYRSETLRLRTPARISFGTATAVDRLLLAAGPAGITPATLDLSGRVAPTLALTASLRGVTPALARPFAPDLHAAGTLTADARLSGTTAAPSGTIHVQGTALSMKTAPFSFLAPGHVTADVRLDGRLARVNAQAGAGPKLQATAFGSVPLQPDGPLAMRVTANTDISLFNPILEAAGRRAAGQVTLDATLGGTGSHPRVDGSATLRHGEVQDYVQGLHVTAIQARLAAAGDTLRIEQFTGRAGQGTLGATGSIGVLAPGLPVDIHVTADHARPLSSDLLTAILDADVTVHGQASGTLDAGGRVLVRSANINIPNALPPSIAVLHVHRVGEKKLPPAPPPAAASNIRLALELDAPSQIFVRGHGLDSELGGKLTIGGTSAAPQVSGGFQMRRGAISVAGTTLTFSHGEVGFDGTSVTNKIDPTLNFVADSISGGVTATLTVGGYADSPTIKLSSVPDLPQDEVLAHLLFGTGVKDLSAIQIAEIASALAQLTGATSGGDPLAAVRRGLGLDRLSVGGGTGSGTGATIEAGRYVARGVFVGAKQATSGGGTAAEVQIDITKRLKATAQLATGGGTVQGATPDNDPGSTVGLSYGFEY